MVITVIILNCEKFLTQKSPHKSVEYDHPGELSPLRGLLFTLTDVLTACAVVIFRVKVSCITSVNGIEHWLLTDNNQSLMPLIDMIQLTLTLKMTTAKVVKTTASVSDSPIQDYVHLDDHAEPTYFLLCSTLSKHKLR